jgi:hypothetical protein
MADDDKDEFGDFSESEDHEDMSDEEMEALMDAEMEENHEDAKIELAWAAMRQQLLDRAIAFTANAANWKRLDFNQRLRRLKTTFGVMSELTD